MSLPGWPAKPELGNVPCVKERDSWQCPNMKSREDDVDMSHEHYDCKLCGRHIALDYDEMR